MGLAPYLLSASLQYQTKYSQQPWQYTHSVVNIQGTQHRAARVIEQDGYADELRLIEVRRPSVSRCPAHTRPFICAFLSLHSQPSRFLSATQDRGWCTQRVFNLPKTTASIKARKATTALCQRVGWGRWAESLGGPASYRGNADGWMRAGFRRCRGRPAWGFFVHKGGYLYLPSNNGMQTRKARTIKHHFGVMKKLLGKSSCKASLGILFTLRFAWLWVCSHAYVWLSLPSVCFCIRYSWLWQCPAHFLTLKETEEWSEMPHLILKQTVCRLSFCQQHLSKGSTDTQISASWVT